MNPQSPEHSESAIQLLKELHSEYRRAREDLQDISSRFTAREAITSAHLHAALEAIALSGRTKGVLAFQSIIQEQRRLPFLLVGPNLLPTPQKFKPTLEVHCLSKFQVRVGSKRIERWRSIKAESLLKYLIAHHKSPVSKDMLMEALWPDCEPSLARNNLKVTVRALRQTLAAAYGTDAFEWILVRDGNYRINPEADVWVDVQQFEFHWDAIRQLEKQGNVTEAIKEYQIAEALYSGDYFEDDVYEEWTTLRREALRNVYLAILAKLADLSLAGGDYQSCIGYCQKILEKDKCREDAYRGLMCSHSRLGQRNSAIRWYRLCETTIRKELDVNPEQMTITLYQKLMHDEYI